MTSLDKMVLSMWEENVEDANFAKMEKVHSDIFFILASQRRNISVSIRTKKCEKMIV